LLLLDASARAPSSAAAAAAAEAEPETDALLGFTYVAVLPVPSAAAAAAAAVAALLFPPILSRFPPTSRVLFAAVAFTLGLRSAVVLKRRPDAPFAVAAAVGVGADGAVVMRKEPLGLLPLLFLLSLD
jgi:hypothetical protein